MHLQIEEDLTDQFLMNFFDDSPYFRRQSSYTGICMALDTATEANQGWKGFGSEIGIPQNQTLDWIDHFTRRSVNSPSPGATLLDFYLRDIGNQNILEKLKSLKKVFAKIDNHDAKRYVEEEIDDRIRISGELQTVNTPQLSKNNHGKVTAVTVNIQRPDEDIPGISESSVANHGNDSGLISLDGTLKVNHTEQRSISSLSADETSLKDEKFNKKPKRKKTFRQRIKHRGSKLLNRKSMRKEILKPPQTNPDQMTASDGDGHENEIFVDDCEQPSELFDKSIQERRVKKSIQNSSINNNLSDECADELRMAALEVGQNSHERKVSKQSIMSKDSGIDIRPNSRTYSTTSRLSSLRPLSLGVLPCGLHSVFEHVDGTTVMNI